MPKQVGIGRRAFLQSMCGAATTLLTLDEALTAVGNPRGLPSDLVHDLVGDFGGDSEAWLEFLAGASQGLTYQLNIPAGEFEIDVLAVGSTSAIIQGAGPENTTITLGIHGLGTGAGIPEFQPGIMVFPRIATTSEGATTVTLLDPADAALITEGHWVCIMAYALMHFGYPPNNQFFEFNRITGIDTLTGVLTLENPLAFDYSADYPDLPGVEFSASDRGGAACIAILQDKDPAWSSSHQGWDQEIVVRNLTINNDINTERYFGQSKSITFDNVKFTGWKPATTVCKLQRFYNCTLGGGDAQEVDKLVERLEYEDCTLDNYVLIQSSSITELVALRCISAAHGFLGLPASYDLTDCTLALARVNAGFFGTSKKRRYNELPHYRI